MSVVISVPGQFEEEFDSLYLLARSVAFRILGSVTEAEDAAAEAMTRALLDWRRVGGLPHREAWVQKVAASVAIDVVRRRSPADRALGELAHRDPGTTTDRSDEAVLRLTMAAALAELPRRQREVVVMRHLIGYGEAETAAALGLSTNSIKKHLQRGMDKLRRSAGAGDVDGGIDVAFE